MLSKEQNEYLTRVGPGTPGGELMRRYWHPIYTDAQLREKPVRKVRILCEDLVLFRDRSGKLGLVQERCPHRMTSLSVGIPEQEGLRCCYHGWLFDSEGQCLEQPLESSTRNFKDRVKIKAYPVQEMGGLIWAYLGPAPVPLLPRWDLFVRQRGFRQIVGHQLPCNWLQAMENRGDLGHAVFLHGRLFQYDLERKGRLTDDPNARYNATMTDHQKLKDKDVQIKYRPIFNEFGFTKGSLRSDQSEDSRTWTVGMNPIIFPYLLAFGPEEGDGRIRRSYQFGVPIDDTHTWHVQYFCYVFPQEVAVPFQDVPPYVEMPLKDDNGEYILDYVLAQDMVAWAEQGEIADRSQEQLGASDSLVVTYRTLLKNQIDLVQQGREPMNVFRDPARINSPELSIPGNEGPAPVRDTMYSAAVSYRENFHKESKGGWLYIDDDADRCCPDRDLIVEMFRAAELVRARQAERA
ncbi:MAG: Rieske (2Fe-2S) protein [Hyphomicrobiales bacterium]|jgi:5,5'-dehydrodivanillate O-demethylase|nr:Rieske (2Fe-2S) protein [Hyphomicrobiales bacterium]